MAKGLEPVGDADPGISREVVECVVRGLAELGFAAPALSPSRTFQVIPGAQADALLDAASQRLGITALSVALAQQIPIGGLGLPDYGTCVGPTLGAGLQRLGRHYALVSQRVALSLIDSPPRAKLRFTRDPTLAVSRHWVEFSIALIAQRIGQVMGSGAHFERVTFVHPSPGDEPAYQRHFGCPVQFGAPEDALCFPSALLGQPLRGATAALAELLESRMRDLERQDGADAFLARVRTAIVEVLEEGNSDVNGVAKRLATSRRTLQRELERRGASYRGILDDLRKRRALQLLEDRALPVTEVAARLGFSEPSSFFRAFRRWTGGSPALHRAPPARGPTL